MAGLGLVFASVLAAASKRFRVQEDPRIANIENTLPGVNCGACGFTSCHFYAEALAKGKISPNECRAGGEEVIEGLSDILGVQVGKKVKEIAVVRCGADNSKRKRKAAYVGVESCSGVENEFGGDILCEYGCLGYGDCRNACPFGAIEIVNGLPEINKDKCIACGKCVKACPRGLITVEKAGEKGVLYVACSSRDKGSDTRKACPVGCIACGICQKLSGGIFYVEQNLARVRREKSADLANSKEVVDKCPTKCITEVT